LSDCPKVRHCPKRDGATNAENQFAFHGCTKTNKAAKPESKTIADMATKAKKTISRIFLSPCFIKALPLGVPSKRTKQPKRQSRKLAPLTYKERWRDLAPL